MSSQSISGERTQLLRALDSILDKDLPAATKLQQVMQLLHDRLATYHWVGIYLLDGQTLRLGPYVGPATDHKEIPLGRGVCGTAVAQGANQIVADVRALSNYLACNLETRSEIVVLIRDPETRRVLGQIDVDGTEIGAFGPSEEAFLTAVAERLVPYVKALNASESL